MLRIIDEEYFMNTMKKTLELDKEYEYKFNLIGKLLDQLKYLNSYADHELNGSTIVELHKDHAQLSFYFIMKKKREENYVQFMNGGLIFHNGSGFDDGTFSVEIAPPKGPHWSVHT